MSVDISNQINDEKGERKHWLEDQREDIPTEPTDVKGKEYCRQL